MTKFYSQPTPLTPIEKWFCHKYDVNHLDVVQFSGAEVCRFIDVFVRENSPATLCEGETPGDYIVRRIREAFFDLAGELGDTPIDGTPEQVGGIPLELLSKEEALLSAWRAILADDELLQNLHSGLVDLGGRKLRPVGKDGLLDDLIGIVETLMGV